MGNTVVWKPSPTQQLAAHLTDAAAGGGRPAAGRHQHGAPATGSTSPRSRWPTPTWPASTSPARPATFQHLWRTVGDEHRVVPLLPAHRRRDRRQGLRGRPPQRRPRRAAHGADPRRVRVPGPEVLAPPPAPTSPRVGVGRGCEDEFVAEVDGLTMGDVTDLSNFMGAVIDERAFAKHKAPSTGPRRDADLSIAAPAAASTTRSATSSGRPSWSRRDPKDEIFTTEYFGPILAVHVYDDAATTTRCCTQMESVAPYALTGSIIAQDRARDRRGPGALRFAAGNFYVNDKPTGAVVGQQPFGGAPGLRHQRQGRLGRRTCCAGPARGRSRRPSSRRPTTATRTWAEGGSAAVGITG